MSTMMRRAILRGLWTGLASLLLLTASDASAETLLMPNRDFRMHTSEVVWGVTTQANGTAFTLDYGDGSTLVTGTVVDQSYMAFNHTYTLPGTYTVTLTVGPEQATVEVTVYNTAAMSAFDARSVNVNRMIQDGLRFLWTQQRGPNGETRAANFPLGAQAVWGREPSPYTALVTAAFERHGYRLPADPAVAPTGLFEKYIVRRGLNYVLNILSPLNVTMQPAGNPCVGSGAGPDPDGAGPTLCVGLQANEHVLGPSRSTRNAFETARAIMAFSSSGALNRVVAEIPGTRSNGYVIGKTYGEVLQRMVNAMAWGQTDTRFGRGGWWLWFNDEVFAGTTQVTGYAFPALLEAEAVGAVIPSFVRPEWARYGLLYAMNYDGSFDGDADNMPNRVPALDVASAGVGVQGMFFAGRPVGNFNVQNTLRYIRDRWAAQGGSGNVCRTNRMPHKGCAEAMFGVFNALRSYGIETLPGIGRPAGPGAIPADDWYADYVDWLLANQTDPTTPTGGHWAPLDSAPNFADGAFSDVPQATALAELILAPTSPPIPAGALKLEGRGQWHFAAQPVPVTPGVAYIAGLYVKGGTVLLQAYSAAWTALSSTYCTGGSTAYVLCSLPIANPADNATINLAVFDSTGISTVYMDDMFLAAAAGGPNLLPNSDFASSTGLFFTSPSPFVVSTEGGRVPSTSSSGSLQWVAGGTWPFTYQPVAVTPGAAYTVGFAVKGSTAKVQIYSNYSPWTEIAGGYCTGESSAYRWCSFTFVNPPDNTIVNLAIYDAATGGAAGYADDIWLSPSSGSANLVSNPGFESLEAWLVSPHFAIIPAGGVPKP